jgi:hypothetical protein
MYFARCLAIQLVTDEIFIASKFNRIRVLKKFFNKEKFNLKKHFVAAQVKY